MFNRLKEKYLEKKNRNNPNICANCVWWKSEDENMVPHKKHAGYCDILKEYKVAHDSCNNFTEEKFEADENSTSTPELDLNIDLEIEKNRIEGNINDTRNEQK